MLQRLQDIGGKKSMNRIYKAFENKKAFIGFLTAGDPVIDKTVDYILDMEQAGASLIEIGIPFSDPIAEGPTIQEANVRALKNKVTTDDVFEMVKKVREKSDIPLCFMTYLNVVFHYGYDEFFKKCQEVGIDGIILPDLPYEENQEVKDVCYNYDVTLISMIAPTSKDRVEMIAKEAKGFIYLVSSMGVTGTRDNTSFSNNLEEIIEHINNESLSTTNNSSGGEENDVLLDEAIQLVVEYQQVSTSFIQRKFKIGFNRASRIMEELEAQGIISERDGSKPRKVLISKDEIYNKQ